MLKLLIVLFLLGSIVALFVGLCHLITAKESSVKTFQSLKYRVILAGLCISLIGLYLFTQAVQS